MKVHIFSIVAVLYAVVTLTTTAFAQVQTEASVMAAGKNSEAGGICTNSRTNCEDVARTIMLLNNPNLSIQAHCAGMSFQACSTSTPFYIRTQFRQLN